MSICNLIGEEEIKNGAGSKGPSGTVQIAALVLLALLIPASACMPKATPRLTLAATAVPILATAAPAQGLAVLTLPPTWTLPPMQDGTLSAGPAVEALPSATPRPTNTPWPSSTPTATAPPPTASATTAPTATPSLLPTSTLQTATPATIGGNLLPNPSFELGWYNLNGLPELQLPNQWTLEWVEGPNPFDPDPWNVFVRPESRVLPRDFLPPQEHPLFIWDGDHTVKIFKGEGAISFRLLSHVYLPAGTYRLEISVFPDLIVGYNPDGSKIWAPDPLSGEVRFVIAEGGSPWYLPRFGQKNTLNHTFSVPTAQTLQIGIAIRGRWAIENNGWFMDDWSLNRLAD